MSAKDKDALWEKSFLALVDYKGKYGDCNIASSRDPSKNPYGNLYTWSDKQRHYRRLGRMAESRIQRLTALGFSWNGMARDCWEERFRELEEFRAKHGHCNVPQLQGSLGNWVKKMRASHNEKRMPQDKIDRFNAIGFNWKMREGRKRKSATATEGGDEENPAAAAEGGSPPKKKQKRSASKRWNPTLSQPSFDKLTQVFTELACQDDTWGDWVTSSNDFLETMTRGRKTHQQTCLQMICSVQQQLEKWNESLSEIKTELVDLVNKSQRYEEADQQEQQMQQQLQQEAHHLDGSSIASTATDQD